MKIIALVPVKKYSNRVPNKNFSKFYDGKSLLKITLEKLSRIDLIDSIFVFSSSEIDSSELEETRALYLNRSPSLDTDLTSMNQIIEEFISKVNADIYVLIHVTSPFISEIAIQKGINSILEDGYDSSFSVIRKQEFYWNEKNEPNYNLDFIPRTQDLPPIYIETSGFYAFRKDVFVKYYRRIGVTPYMVNIGNIEAIDIDDVDDYKLAQIVYAGYRK